MGSRLDLGCRSDSRSDPTRSRSRWFDDEEHAHPEPTLLREQLRSRTIRASHRGDTTTTLDSDDRPEAAVGGDDGERDGSARQPGPQCRRFRRGPEPGRQVHRTPGSAPREPTIANCRPKVKNPTTASPARTTRTSLQPGGRGGTTNSSLKSGLPRSSPGSLPRRATHVHVARNRACGVRRSPASCGPHRSSPGPSFLAR